jgi:hypothetical protein
VEAEQTPTTEELAEQNIDVYDGRTGPWNPDHGEVEIPDGWEFLPTGDAYLTRTVKTPGRYWLCWRPRSRNRKHRRLLGIWAPAETIHAAEEKAQQSATRRATARVKSEKTRARQEGRYHDELRDAVLEFLAFTPEHAELAADIADKTATHAAVVGSGRVGRTRLLSLQERAALAARAHIRHHHTDYHHDLDRIPLVLDDDELYREARGSAHLAVDEFLRRHRGD